MCKCLCANETTTLKTANTHENQNKQLTKVFSVFNVYMHGFAFNKISVDRLYWNFIINVTNHCFSTAYLLFVFFNRFTLLFQQEYIKLVLAGIKGEHHLNGDSFSVHCFANTNIKSK